MAETSGFFNAHVTNGEYDRVYLAEQFAKYFASFIGNGIFGGKLSELMVIQHDDAGMRIKVLPGMSWINGFWYENSSDLTIDVDVSDGVVNRIDNVVVRWGKVERKIWIEIVKGTPATNATAPSIKRNSEYYDLKIAELHINAGLTSITQANIIDTRLNNDVCGLVTGLIDQIDTSGYAEQMSSYISYLSTSASNYASEFKAYLEELELSSVSELDSLFDRLNALIEDESAFAALALKVDDTASETALLSQTLGYTKKNLIPYPYVQTTKVDNGIIWTDNGNGTITANGTATANSTFRLYTGKIPGNTILTGGIAANARLQIVNRTNEVYTVLARDEGSGNGSLVDISKYDEGYIELLIMAGESVSDAIFKPMLRRVEILDGTWEPYRLSVDELLNRDYKYGIEYATNEIWNGKRIYQKTFYVASLPSKSTLAIEVDCIYTNVIHVSGFAIDSINVQYYQFPIILNGFTPIAVISNVMEETDTTSSIIIRTNEDVSAFKGYITIKYVKD